MCLDGRVADVEPLRVRWRGAFGRKASATLRWLYPIVLGLGEWFLGVLIVITTMPSVALDIAWDRQARDRFVEGNAKETLEARPSTG